MTLFEYFMLDYEVQYADKHEKLPRASRTFLFGFVRLLLMAPLIYLKIKPDPRYIELSPFEDLDRYLTVNYLGSKLMGKKRMWDYERNYLKTKDPLDFAIFQQSVYQEAAKKAEKAGEYQKAEELKEAAEAILKQAQKDIEINIADEAINEILNPKK